MSRTFNLIALAVASVAVAAPIAYAGTAPGPRAKVDPLAVGYLQRYGLSPSQVRAWTTGVCSHRVKPAACFGPSKGAALGSTSAYVDPLAVGYLKRYGFSPSQVRAWTTGVCSHRVKPASCFVSFEKTAAAQASRSGGFDWGDAGIGAAVTLGLMLLLAGLGARLGISRQNHRRQIPIA